MIVMLSKWRQSFFIEIFLKSTGSVYLDRCKTSMHLINELPYRSFSRAIFPLTYKIPLSNISISKKEILIYHLINRQVLSP